MLDCDYDAWALCCCIVPLHADDFTILARSKHAMMLMRPCTESSAGHAVHGGQRVDLRALPGPAGRDGFVDAK